MYSSFACFQILWLFALSLEVKCSSELIANLESLDSSSLPICSDFGGHLFGDAGLQAEGCCLLELGQKRCNLLELEIENVDR
jgi:hypothetical protein